MISHDELQNLFDAHHEWLLIYPTGRSFALQKTEIELSFERGRTLLGFLDDKGFQWWRVTECKTKNDEILLHLARNFEKERAKIRLVPRAPAKALSESVELARLEKAHRLAALIGEQFPKTKLVRVALNKVGGRFAQIDFEDFNRRRIAALSDVSDSVTPESLLTAAISRLAGLQRRKKNPVVSIWLLAEKKQARKLRMLHALLKANWQSVIRVREISRAEADAQSGEVVKELPTLRIADLWRGRPRESKPAENAELTATAREIIEIAPGEIDAVLSKRGETLRFNGLPFARVRKVLNRERVWFGREKSRPLLAENNFAEFTELVESLRKNRCAGAANKRHAFYTDAPEAWLEARLRKNIELLDANLILSPLYHQFRAERDKIDLLALRRDGRLVIIEVKTSPDRAMPFQIADYWRKIERQRRAGNLKKAGLFGDLEIADAPAICYAVAPTLSFHRDFEFLAGTLSPQIEIHRFHLAENWRENLKVFERREINARNSR